MIRVPPYGPETRKVVDEWNAVIAPSTARHPVSIAISKGDGVFIEDVDGNVYLDFSSGVGVMNLGHHHPKIVEAIKEQLGRFMHISSHIGWYEEYIRIASRLREIMPRGFRDCKVLLINSGTEAVEAAIKLVRFSTRKNMILAFFNAYHGRTLGALSLTTRSPTWRRHLTSVLVGAEHVPYPYCYRCIFNQEHTECGLYCLEYLRGVFETTCPTSDLAAVIIEPIQGESGCVVPPDDYLPALAKICREEGILFIADEVQSGMGRTGKMFALEHWDLVPDVMTIGKAVGGGLPLGATIGRSDLMDEWVKDSHGSTFGGNPVSCVAGCKTIETIVSDGLLKNAEQKGNSIRKRLWEMYEDHELIGDIRGKGLMIGVELVADRERKEPLKPDTRQKILMECLKRGLFLIGAGTSSIRLYPPLTITEEQVEQGLNIFEEALRAFKD